MRNKDEFAELFLGCYDISAIINDRAGFEPSPFELELGSNEPETSQSYIGSVKLKLLTKFFN